MTDYPIVAEGAYNNLSILIEELKEIKFEFSAICLQETWLEEGADLSQFQIPNYTCIAQGKYCSQHGGLITYINNKYIFYKLTLPVKSNLWEGLVVCVSDHDGKTIHICNIYCPDSDNLTNALITTFYEQLIALVLDFQRKNSTILTLGDFNINL